MISIKRVTIARKGHGLKRLKHIALNQLHNFCCVEISMVNVSTTRRIITENLYPYINYLTGRKPIILPIILDIKK